LVQVDNEQVKLRQQLPSHWKPQASAHLLQYCVVWADGHLAPLSRASD